MDSSGSLVPNFQRSKTLRLMKSVFHLSGYRKEGGIFH